MKTFNFIFAVLYISIVDTLKLITGKVRCNSQYFKHFFVLQKVSNHVEVGYSTVLHTRKDAMTATCSMWNGTIPGLKMAAPPSWSDQQDQAKEAVEWHTPEEEQGREQVYPRKKTFSQLDFLTKYNFLSTSTP